MITIVESQRVVNFILPLFPLFILFFIGSVAETNRPPFDLAEAESELVSGFMTEHSASIFVFFFLAEYSSIVLICILNSILFAGGYLFIIPSTLLFDILNSVLGLEHSVLENIFSYVSSSPLNLAFKTIFFVFAFI
jgi:NADH:ubiquinone oxidoreductase subunit H